MKSSFCILFILLLVFTNAAVYEARNSDDVDFFLAHNPEENGALMFYDPKTEQSDPKVGDNVKKIVGIFKNIGEEGRSEEDWVNKMNDKVHLMRIDSTNMDNARSVDDYKVSQTPFLVLLDYGKVIMMERVTEKTSEHVKDVIVARNEEKKKVEEAKKKEEAKKAEDAKKAGQGAQSDVEQAKKAAEGALKALEELRKAFEEHLEVEKARDDAEEAKKKAEKAQKDLEELTKKLNQGGKNSTQGDQNNQGVQTKQIQYVPVYTRLNQPSTYTTVDSAAPRVVYSGGEHWHVLDGKR